MAFRSYMRFGWIGAALVATMAITAPSYADTTTDRTFATSDGWGTVIVISYDNAFDHMKAFADIVAMPAAVPGSNVRSIFKPAPIKQRASRSAVRPTAIAGWRSGRTRHLAAA